MKNKATHGVFEKNQTTHNSLLLNLHGLQENFVDLKKCGVIMQILPTVQRDVTFCGFFNVIHKMTVIFFSFI